MIDATFVDIDFNAQGRSYRGATILDLFDTLGSSG